MKHLITLLIYSSIGFSNVTTLLKEKINCPSTKEYITTTLYLRDQKDFGLSEKEIQQTADKVSLGCVDSSDRFIKTLKLLTKLGIDTRSSLEIALELSAKSNAHAEAFIEIFKYS